MWQGCKGSRLQGLLKEIVCVLIYNVIQLGILGRLVHQRAAAAQLGEMSCSSQQAQAEKLTLLVAEN